MIGDRIKEIREKNSMTQAFLAKKFGISRSAVNAWEMGVSVPSAQYLIELSKLFKTSTDYILGLSEHETIDISFLAEEDKKIFYTLINHFEKYQKAIEIIDKVGYNDVKKEYESIKESGVEVPEYIVKAFEHFLGEEE